MQRPMDQLLTDEGYAGCGQPSAFIVPLAKWARAHAAGGCAEEFAPPRRTSRAANPHTPHEVMRRLSRRQWHKSAAPRQLERRLQLAGAGIEFATREAG